MLASSRKIGFYSALLRIRPTQLGDLLKRCLHVRRRYIRTRTGHTFWADPASVFGLQLLRDGIYEPQMVRILELVLRPDDTFVDVGGGEGYFSILASGLIPRGDVHCIEPQTGVQAVLRENIRINSAHSVMVHQRALSSSEGEVTLFLRPSTNPGASSLFRHWRMGSGRERVCATTLDAFFEDNFLEQVRLLKVDCEGAEYLVVSGGHQVLQQQRVDFIALEYHAAICGVERCTTTHEELKRCGYVLTKVYEQYIYHLPGLEGELRPLGELRVDCGWDV